MRTQTKIGRTAQNIPFNQAFQKVPQVSWGWKAYNLHISKMATIKKAKTVTFEPNEWKTCAKYQLTLNLGCRINFRALLISLKSILGFNGLFCKKNYKKNNIFFTVIFYEIRWAVDSSHTGVLGIHLYYKLLLIKHETLNRCWCNAVRAMQAVGQHYSSIGLTSFGISGDSPGDFPLPGVSVFHQWAIRHYEWLSPWRGWRVLP